MYTNNNLTATQSYVTSQGFITSTPGVDVNMNAKYLNFTNGWITMIGNRIIYFILIIISQRHYLVHVSCYGQVVMYWVQQIGTYGFGMNGGQLIYNVPSGQMHSFQVNGTQLLI